MAPLNILICGGGIAGPALAFWLVRAGHTVTIVERAEGIRESGAQVDIREQGIQVMKRMGLESAIRPLLVKEEGAALVDSQGRTRAAIMANRSGRGAQTMTSEYEIMRGDMARVLYEATRERVRYVFGTSVESFDQTPEQQGVTARFSDGTTARFDLLVGADGQGSRIRQAVLPEGTDPYLRMGVHAAYLFMPRIDTDKPMCEMRFSPGNRMMMRRSHSPTHVHAYLFAVDSSPELSSLPRAPVETQKAFYAARFRDAGWQADRFVRAMQADDAKFYCQEILQVRIDRWSKGRAVLVGDAAHCASPFSGMGVTGALVGAYVLAAEISRNPADLPRAFTNYESTLRPFIDEIQKFHPAVIPLMIPKYQWTVNLIYIVATVICWLRIPEILARWAPEDKGGWKLPQYPELD